MKSKKIILGALFTAINSFVFAANFYWVGGTGNWSDYSNHWATTSGGASFHSNAPTASDDVFFDASSGGGTVSLDTDGTCASITISSGQTLAVVSNTFSVTGNATIAGTISLSTGTIDVDGTFDATGGTITFLGAGNLNLGGATITSLGTLTNTVGTVTYDRAGDQTIFEDTYFNLKISGTGIKSITGTTTQLYGAGLLTVESGATLAIGDNELKRTTAVSNSAAGSAISGTVTINNGLWTTTFGILQQLTSSGGTITCTGTGTIRHIASTSPDFGTFTAGNGTVQYNRAGDQNIASSPTYYNLLLSGSTKSLIGTTNVTNDLTNSGALNLDTYTLTVDGTTTNSGSITVYEALTLNGDFVNNGTLTLKSDVTGTATLLLSGNLTGSGSTTIEQYLAGGSRNYYLGSPISSSTGVVFDNTNESKFYHNASDQRYYTLADGDALNVLQGYVYRSADVNTLEFTGTLNNGALSNNSLPRVGTSNPYRGYNLVSNPYPSFIDWKAVTKTNLESSMWFRTHDGANNVFDTYNATSEIGTNNNGGGAVTEFIPPMQGFWVRVDADGNTGQIAFDNTMRSHQTGVLRVAQDKQIFRFVVRKDNQTDESVIVFNPNAKEGVEDYDSRKMYSNVKAQVATVVNNEDLVINGLPYADGASVVTKVTLKEDGIYSLEATEQTAALSYIQVVLEDKLTDTKVSFNVGEKYSFKGNTTDANRFVIHFGDIPLSTSNVNATAPIIFASNKQITVKLAEVNNAKATVYNISGQLVQTVNVSNTFTQINTNLPSGVYLVEINNGGTLTREKVVIE
jgi:hypothetical protein